LTVERGSAAGFSLVEMLVSTTVLLLCLAGLAAMMVENSKLNRSEQMAAQVQADARNCLAMVVQKLRGAGWDPMNAGIPTLALDADPTDGIEEIEIFSDIDEDGTTDGLDEQVLIRHEGSNVSWRRDSDTGSPFEIVASSVTNDADGDGTPEPMFEPDSATAPTRVNVRITARSPTPDPVSGDYIRYTLASEVAFRKEL
jgi:type II secretory pathway pseudopilin PulG